MSLTGRLWDIWQGTAKGLTEEQCEAYRQLWRGKAADPNFVPTETGAKVRTDCAHLGPETDRIECPSCIGKVLVKVMLCSVHGRCSLGKKIEGIACCATCPDYSSSH